MIIKAGDKIRLKESINIGFSTFLDKSRILTVEKVFSNGKIDAYYDSALFPDGKGLLRLNENEYEIVSMVDNSSDEPEAYDYIKPSHYKKGSKEVWEMMVYVWGREAFIAHCEMSAFKYRMRAGDKPEQPVERDLEKARWYENKAKELRDE